MELDPNSRREWISWAGVGLLVLLCCALAILQYRWIGEVAQAEHARLQEDLRSRLNLLRRSFDEQVSSACAALVPPSQAVERVGREEAYLEQYRRAQQAKDQIARRIALAIPEDDSLSLEILDPALGRFTSAAWPREWNALHDRLVAKVRHEPFRPAENGDSTLIEFPRFGPPDPREREWLIVELNLDVLRGDILPALLNRYLGSDGKLDYDAEVVVNGNPPEIIYQSGPPQQPGASSADASITLLDIPQIGPMPGPGRGMFMPPGPNRGPDRFSDRGLPPGPGPQPPPDAGRGRWLLKVHHHAGSLEAIVAQARWRNVALSGALLLLILAVAASLLRLSRERQRIAELEMNFVAGVSHELRTPLTVIQTAAFNLRGRLANYPGQVERYGQLIQAESEKLTALVERVLRYGSVKAGQVIRRREPVEIGALIEESLEVSRSAVEHAGLVVEKHVEAQLPVVLADEVALQHAIQNLLENALKYGTEGTGWIGIFAGVVRGQQGSAVEIRVVDRGPGIPAEEREHIFDPFFRGRKALADQVHGTGLGLNLVKKIVEAHGGAIEVKSEPMQGAEFIIRIPAAPPEFQHEFAHTVD
ncbi:MAG TPA: HAMP domain-containing sensor histidine kinase [Bryobacteraceae bacterium]|nr:HAMP domain-containing sensor histidine kinase [Bryobacteraceae bacterium]